MKEAFVVEGFGGSRVEALLLQRRVSKGTEGRRGREEEEEEKEEEEAAQELKQDSLSRK